MAQAVHQYDMPIYLYIPIAISTTVQVPSVLISPNVSITTLFLNISIASSPICKICKWFSHVDITVNLIISMQMIQLVLVLIQLQLMQFLLILLTDISIGTFTINAIFLLQFI